MPILIDPPLSSDEQHALLGEGIAGIVGAITKRYSFARDIAGQLYYFESGRYVCGGVGFLEQLCWAVYDSIGRASKWTPYKSTAVLRYMKANVQLLSEKPSIRYINLLNGVFDLETRTLHSQPTASQWKSPVQLPIIYNPQAKATRWEKLITDVFPEDATRLALEIPTWLMVPMMDLQVSLLLTGEGSNGKSVFLDGLKAFIGPENTVDCSIHELQERRFSTQRLLHKLVNICTDLPTRKLTENYIFKAIVGQDRISAEVKFGDHFYFTPYTRFVFSCNKPPVIEDDTDAWYRRFIIIPFDKQFERVPRMRDILMAELTSEQELSGMLNNAIELYADVRKNGLTVPISCQLETKQYRHMRSDISKWLRVSCVHDPSSIGLTSSELYESYRRADPKGSQYLTQKAFGQRLRSLFPQLENAVVRVGDSTKRVYRHLAFRLVAESIPTNNLVDLM